MSGWIQATMQQNTSPVSETEHFFFIHSLDFFFVQSRYVLESVQFSKNLEKDLIPTLMHTILTTLSNFNPTRLLFHEYAI